MVSYNYVQANGYQLIVKENVKNAILYWKYNYD